MLVAVKDGFFCTYGAASVTGSIVPIIALLALLDNAVKTSATGTNAGSSLAQATRFNLASRVASVAASLVPVIAFLTTLRVAVSTDGSIGAWLTWNQAFPVRLDLAGIITAT